MTVINQIPAMWTKGKVHKVSPTMLLSRNKGEGLDSLRQNWFHPDNWVYSIHIQRHEH